MQLSIHAPSIVGKKQMPGTCRFSVARVFYRHLLEGFLRGFWARGRVRGDRSVFVTSHRLVHLSRALLFSAWFELLHFRTGAIFLV